LQVAAALAVACNHNAANQHALHVAGGLQVLEALVSFLGDAES
jgi:hypothetical protein